MPITLLLATLLAGETLSIPGLVAPQPYREHREELMLFGQFVGDWDLDVVNHQPDGSLVRRTGTWSFRWILEGRGVQDVWTVSAAEDSPVGSPPAGYGTTVRVFDRNRGAWNVTWIGVLTGGDATKFVARKVDKEIVMEARGDEGPFRWIFFDMQKDSFKWRAVEGDAEGRTWKLRQEMFVRRRALGAGLRELRR